MAAEWWPRVTACCEGHWGGCSGIGQKCKLYHTLSELHFTFCGFFPVGSATTLLVEEAGDEGDHGSAGRVGRADLQLSEPARGEVDRATRHWPTRNAPSPRDETEGPSPRRALHGRACCSKP